MLEGSKTFARSFVHTHCGVNCSSEETASRCQGLFQCNLDCMGLARTLQRTIALQAMNCKKSAQQMSAWHKRLHSNSIGQSYMLLSNNFQRYDMSCPPTGHRHLFTWMDLIQFKKLDKCCLLKNCHLWAHEHQCIFWEIVGGKSGLIQVCCGTHFLRIKDTSAVISFSSLPCLFVILFEIQDDLQILEGRDGKGPVAWKVDVKAQLAGWAITLRTADGSPSEHIKFWLDVWLLILSTS